METSQIIAPQKARVQQRPSFFGSRTPEEIRKSMNEYMKSKVGHHVGPVSYKGGR